MKRKRLLKSIPLFHLNTTTVTSPSCSISCSPCSCSIPPSIWKDLRISPLELRPQFTLVTGQTFGWKQIDNYDIWIGVIKNYPLAIKQTTETVLYTCLFNDNDIIEEDLNNTILSYFQLEVNLVDLYKFWGDRCPRIKTVSQCFPGVRVLRQDPWECLASFIFSSNNNIKRITKGLQLLRSKYGQYLCSVVITQENLEIYIEEELVGMVENNSLNQNQNENENNNENISNQYQLYTFPTPNELFAHSNETLLREIGMGYRAKYLYESCRMIISKGGVDWLYSLRQLPYSEIHRLLQTLPGIGAKVADCIALFSLNQSHIIPVDTHMLTITLRDYPTPFLQQQTAKTLTNKIYNEVQNIFQSKFGNYAGWAHSLLFTGELSDFKQLLPIELQNEMNDYTKEKRKLNSKKDKKNQNQNQIENQIENNNENENNEMKQINNENKQKKKKKKEI